MYRAETQRSPRKKEKSVVRSLSSIPLAFLASWREVILVPAEGRGWFIRGFVWNGVALVLPVPWRAERGKERRVSRKDAKTAKKDGQMTPANSFWVFPWRSWRLGARRKERRRVYLAKTQSSPRRGEDVQVPDNGTEDIWWILEGKDYPSLWWEQGDGASPF